MNTRAAQVKMYHFRYYCTETESRKGSANSIVNGRTTNKGQTLLTCQWTLQLKIVFSTDYLC